MTSSFFKFADKQREIIFKKRVSGTKEYPVQRFTRNDS